MTNVEPKAIATAHRMVLAGAVVTFAAAMLPFKFSLGAIPFALYCAWRMTRAIRATKVISAIYLVLMLIPVVNVLALISLNIKGSCALKAGGVKVGLFGVRSADLPAD